MQIAPVRDFIGPSGGIDRLDQEGVNQARLSGQIGEGAGKPRGDRRQALQVARARIDRRPIFDLAQHLALRVQRPLDGVPLDGCQPLHAALPSAGCVRMPLTA